jgi:hypothetical protein
MSVQHERALRLRGLVPAAPVDIPWRTHTVLLRAVFFVLTLVGIGAVILFFHLISLSMKGVVAGVIAIAVAEFLIRKRWWWTGVEEALWIGGVYAMLSELPSSGTPESNLVLAAGAALPGVRVRNPLFGALAAIFIVIYFEERFDLGVIAALVIGVVASIALLRTWQRPSTEWLWIVIAIVMPLAGYANADPAWRTVTIPLYAAFALFALMLAIAKRHHALFLTGGIAVAIASIELGRVLEVLPLEAKLALGGAFLLGGSWLTARALRDRTRGIVVTPAALTPFDDAVEVAATVNLPQQDFTPAQQEGGGEFGGAGATGKY